MSRSSSPPARLSRRRVLTGALGGAALLALPHRHAAQATALGPLDTPSAIILQTLNDLRAAHGLPALHLDPHLSTVAAGWSARMAGGVGLAHNPRHREEYGWPTHDASEVVAYVRDPGAGVEALAGTIVQVWMGSAAHRATLLGGAWSDIGIGCAWGGDGRLYATADVVRADVPAAAAEALALSREIAAATAPRMVIARCDIPSDALVAAPLLGASAPLLLARPGQALAGSLVGEISRAATPQTTVYIVGGGFPAAVEEQVRATGAVPMRLAGPSRYDTAAVVAAQAAAVRTRPWLVQLVLADAWPDAVSAAGPSAHHGTPILLLDRDGVPAATRRVLDAHPDALRAVIGGGISDDVVDAIRGFRLQGADRAGTGVAVMDALWERRAAAPGDAFLVTPGWTADGWATALAHTSWAAANRAPLLFSSTGVPPPVHDALRGLGYGDAAAGVTRFARHVPAAAQQAYRALIGG